MYGTKRQFMKFIVFTLVLSFLLLQSFQPALAASTVNAKKITLNKKSITLEVGESQALKATVSPANTTSKKVKWSSNDKEIATVTSTGKVIAIGAGRTIITAKTSNGKKAMCKVTVKESGPTDVDIIEDDITLSMEDEYTLKVRITPASEADAELTWYSDDEDVVCVDDEGNLFPMNEGSAIITVETVNGLTDACTVTIMDNVQDKTLIELSEETLNLKIGDAKQLTANVTPLEPGEVNVTWKSSNSKVVSVDSKGYIRAIKEGAAVIKASLTNGEYDECLVEVNSDYIEVSGISIDYDTATLTVGESIRLSATVSPSNATEQSITWSSSNVTLADVDSTGKVTAKAGGSVTITAAWNNKLFASCMVTIKTKTVAVSTVTLSQKNVTMEVNTSVTLNASISPADATDKLISWQSSNTGIATVDASGKVYGVAKGTATITAKTANGKMDSAQITVKETLVKGSLKDVVYKLTLKGTNVCLDVNGGADKNGTNVQVWENNDSNAQKWRVENHSDGTISLIAQCAPDKVLDVMRTGNSTAGALKAGCNVDIYIHNDSPAQNFTPYQYSDGTYILRLSSNPDLVLTSTGTGSGSNVIINSFDENNSLQRWVITETSAPAPIPAASFTFPTANAYQITVLSYYYGNASKGKHVTKGGGTILGAMDISGPDSDILAAESGTVTAVSYDSGWGNSITIQHDNGFYSFYAHLKDKSITVAVGSKVSKGQKIGVMGSTGNSTGKHLHFEIWDTNKNTCETWIYFRDNYKAKLKYDADIVQGGSNPEAWRTWITSNYKLSGGVYIAK
ncbi:MAG: hypothetical protein K0S47_4578 [Herbinix sp.]|nr:hypothetical protein [Herbinix sp.]